MMFLCNKCGGIFEEATESDTCPHCNSDDFVEARECDGCGECINDDDIHYHEESDSFLCPDCYRSEENKLSPKEEYELSEFLRGWDEYVA